MDWTTWITPETIEKAVRIGFLIALILPLAWYLSRLVGKLVSRHSSPHYGLMTQKLIGYAATVIVIITILSDLGFSLAPLLSAAGIAGIAIGFAAQTTLSNFISGLFLMTEKPFVVGDVITAGSTTGIVLSVDLMSVKLRAFDNKFIRIPSSQLIQSELTNITRFPIRRLDVNVGVAYKEDISKVRRILAEVADRNPHCLDEPAPIIIFQQFGDSSLDFMLGVWCAKQDFLALKNSIMQGVKEAFDAEGIEIPFPHRTLYTGDVTAPFPIAMVERPEPAEKPPV
jgi:small-conductance mechanosensitive channel